MVIGLQTFTIRKYQKKDIEKAYLPLIELGIKDLEISRIKFNQENAKTIKNLVDKYGINVVAIQVKPKDVFGHIDEVVNFCKVTGCKNVVISMLPFSCILGTEKKFYDFLDTLDKYYDTYKAHGIELAYHNHDWEYVVLSNGKMRMDELLERTHKIKFVLDTYWTTKAGVPADVQIQQLKTRLLGIHLRDLMNYKRGLKVFTKNAVIGEGVVDIRKVLIEGEKVGCEYYAIELKTDTPYEEIKTSYHNCMKIKDSCEER